MHRAYRIMVIALVVLAVGVGAFFAGRSTAPSRTSRSSATTEPIGACHISQLRITQSGFAGAAGTIERTFALRNIGSAPCTLYGYPGLVLLGPGTASLPTQLVEGGGLEFERIAPTTVTLAPGGTGYFNVGYSDVTPPCSSTSRIAVSVPGLPASSVVRVAPSILACGGGTLHVSGFFGSTDHAAIKTTAP